MSSPGPSLRKRQQRRLSEPSPTVNQGRKTDRQRLTYLGKHLAHLRAPLLRGGRIPISGPCRGLSESMLPRLIKSTRGSSRKLHNGTALPRHRLMAGNVETMELHPIFNLRYYHPQLKQSSPTFSNTQAAMHFPAGWKSSKFNCSNQPRRLSRPCSLSPFLLRYIPHSGGDLK